MPAGQGHRQLDLDEGRRGRVPAPGAAGAPLRRRGRGDGLRRSRARPTRIERKVEICSRAYKLLTEADRLPARRHHLRPERVRDRHRHRGARRLRGRLHRGHARTQAALPASPRVRRRVERVVLASAATKPVRQAIHVGVPVPRDPRRHGHGHRQRRRAAAATTTSMPDLRERVEDVVLNRRSDGTERLLRDRRHASRARRARRRSRTCAGATSRCASA